MTDVISARRQFMKSSLVLGAAAGLVGFGGNANSPELQQADSRAPELPPEVKIIQSKEYGQKRIQQFQDGVRKAGLDALIISNRSLDYIAYMSNYDPDAMEPGVAFIPAEGSPKLFLQMYSSAHERLARETI